MPLSVLLPLAAFLALAIAFALVLRRTGRVLADTRATEAYRRAVQDLALRVDVSLGGIVERVDAVRRHQVPPDVIADNLVAGLDALRRYAEEADGLGGPPSAAVLADGLRADLGRAERALEMIQHGCAILGSSRGIGRHTEGETAIKRGYLNLLHAREAVAEHAIEIVETRAGTEPAWYGRRRRA